VATSLLYCATSLQSVVPTKPWLLSDSYYWMSEITLNFAKGTGVCSLKWLDTSMQSDDVLQYAMYVPHVLLHLYQTVQVNENISHYFLCMYIRYHPSATLHSPA